MLLRNEKFITSHLLGFVCLGNPPTMPTLMTPRGALDLSYVLFRNRIIFIGQPVNAKVAQQVISQLVTLASIDEDSDILVCLIFCIYIPFSNFCY